MFNLQLHEYSLRSTYRKCPNILYDAQHMKTTLMHFAYNVGPDHCASVLSNLGIFCLSEHTTVSIDSVSGQRRPRSACAYVQADKDLHCPQII